MAKFWATKKLDDVGFERSRGPLQKDLLMQCDRITSLECQCFPDIHG